MLKQDAFPTPCALGANIKARVPKAQQITHQVVIKNVDVEVTQEEIEEILNRLELPYKSVKRIHSRQKGQPTKMFRLVLKEEQTKKRLLKFGINLDQMHYKCIPAIEDTKTYPKILQCFKCQKVGEHQASSCPNEQKCVLCSGPHRKADCTATKESFKCANCNGCHAAWSHECPHLQKAQQMNKTPTMVQVASATVTPAMLKAVIQDVKESMLMLITEIMSRGVCEMVYDIEDNKITKATLKQRVSSIATRATTAANKLKFGVETDPIDAVIVRDRIVEKCFPSTSNSDATPSSQKMVASRS